MEQNYFEKVHQNNIKSSSDIQTTLVFNISKTYQKEISTTIFCLSKYHQNKRAQVTSVVYLNSIKKYTKTTIIFRPSKSGRKKYIETTSIFHLSILPPIKYVETASSFCSLKLHWRKSVETTSIFCPLKLHQTSTLKRRENSSIFSIRRIDVILTSNRRRIDVISTSCARWETFPKLLLLFVFASDHFKWIFSLKVSVKIAKQKG